MKYGYRMYRTIKRFISSQLRIIYKSYNKPRSWSGVVPTAHAFNTAQYRNIHPIDFTSTGVKSSSTNKYMKHVYAFTKQQTGPGVWRPPSGALVTPHFSLVTMTHPMIKHPSFMGTQFPDRPKLSNPIISRFSFKKSWIFWDEFNQR